MTALREGIGDRQGRDTENAPELLRQVKALLRFSKSPRQSGPAGHRPAQTHEREGRAEALHDIVKQVVFRVG